MRSKSSITCNTRFSRDANTAVYAYSRTLCIGERSPRGERSRKKILLAGHRLRSTARWFGHCWWVQHHHQPTILCILCRCSAAPIAFSPSHPIDCNFLASSFIPRFVFHLGRLGVRSGFNSLTIRMCRINRCGVFVSMSLWDSDFDPHSFNPQRFLDSKAITQTAYYGVPCTYYTIRIIYSIVT